ncbi:hypothetical protein N7492_005630 [Penicillium capsulatum]|uniref:F-box domain-containing protein n=1 Tax=Penicillium capsulatum TaxID=69766 RepID=A0A9W9LRB3_9EURO|nr:hypothetical protein N7492_005630 [Penicillium capsulatum]KAJ6135272.1 hypothetical protein N7512_000432 [Penicillium capsulatum]
MEQSTLNKLPGELLEFVLDHADGPSLAGLSRTCRDLNHLTTLRLYRSACIQRGKSNEFMRTIDCKYADLVRDVFVDASGVWDEVSPCRIAPSLEKLPNLRSLALEGTFWHGNATSEEEEMWQTHQDRLWGVLENASLEHSPGSRILQSLRSLTIDLVEGNGQTWFLDSNIVFLIQPLHELTIRGIMFEEEDGEIEPEFHRQTDLKTLRIERSHINFLGLRNVLLAPRGLTHLVLEHDSCKSHHELGNATITKATVDEFVDALSIHRESLQEIHFSERNEENQTINDDSFAPYATRFPVLRHWVGCDVFSLRYYLNDFENN